MAVRMLRRGLGSLVRRMGLRPLHPDIKAVRATGIFDAERYRRIYPDVAGAGVDPLLHYVQSGAKEGRSPCEFFDGAYYLARNPDVRAANINPLVHFCDIGWKESRHPSADFDVDWYLSEHLSGRPGRVNPLVHYLRKGRALGIDIRAVPDPRSKVIRESGVFDEEYYLEQYPDVAQSGLDPIDHYMRYGASESRNPSAMFDTAYYLRNNPDVVRKKLNPLLHFVMFGWKQLRNPSRDFDVWWYWSNHMDPAVEDVNPLGHYQRVGRDLQLDARPPENVAQDPGSGYRHPEDGVVRRICLFAGYDVDGLVDDYVIAYLRELSRFADIYYLADCEMQPGELEKLAPYTKGAWAERHGEYDFGSYSRLARRVGWELIEQYDELLFVNDSCYLLRSLDDVFGRMDTRACDWWGLQATKGIAFTRRRASNRFGKPIPIDTVRGSLLESYERDYHYDFHVGSYFVAYRRPVIGDQEFRRLIESVTQQRDKRNVILKYEVGLTRHLVARGYNLDTFVRHLYPFHPLFTTWHFALLDEGFPLFKRYLLSENHYQVPALADWADRLRQKIPDVDTEMFRRNLERVTDPDKLHYNLHLGTARIVVDEPVPAKRLSGDEFRAADRRSPKYGHWWAFPVCAFSGVFSGNERAVFEQVRNDRSIRKIVLTRGKPVEVDGANVEVMPLESAKGQHRLMRAGNIFIKHSPTRNLVYPVAADLHNIINLWHGIPFKRIGYASADMQQRLPLIAREHERCRAVISSSKVDTLAMAAAFYPLSYGEVWNTGLPRNDFILRDTGLLPDDMQAEEQRLLELVGGRRLVLLMPTFRNAQEDGYYRFGSDEVEFLGQWLRHNNAVLGIREHMADNAKVFSRQLAGLEALDLSDDQFPNVEVLYRVSSALITDYSSCFIDYMLTGKPAISFAYDLDSYLGVERGGFYDLDFVFPGPVCRSFADLRKGLEELFAPRSEAALANMEWKRRLFFDHVDDQSSARVVERVKQLTDVMGIGRPLPITGN